MPLHDRWEQTKKVFGRSWYPIPARVEAWFAKAVLWWIIGGVIATLLADDAAKRAGDGYLAWAGAIYGAIGALIYRTANRYRIQRMLTWPQVIARGLAIVTAWAALSFSLNNWNAVAPILLVVVLFTVYVATGLLVLYLTVRVARAAWRHGAPR